MRACITRRRVVALDQSLVSSRHSRMYSLCSIFVRTMASTCFALACSCPLRRPGAALINPAASDGNASEQEELGGVRRTSSKGSVRR